MSDTTTYSRIWRPDVRRGRIHDDARASVGDLVGNQFDRGVALTGYGLLAFSVFSAGLPAVGALALATAHAKDSHLITRSHYHYQVRIFWSGVMSFILGVLVGVAAAAFALSQVWSWLAERWPWLDQTVGVLVLPGDRTQVAGYLAVFAVILLLYGAVHTLVSSAWGAMKLVAGRPIGHIDAA